jgi:hypothetical protein
VVLLSPSSGGACPSRPRWGLSAKVGGSGLLPKAIGTTGDRDTRLVSRGTPFYPLPIPLPLLIGRRL